MPTTSQSPRDPHSLARLLIDRFGERAVSYATHQALKSAAAGDHANAARWRRIADVTREALRADLDGLDRSA